MTAPPVEFYFDFSSPYGYIGAELVGDVAARHGRAVTWRPYLMGALFKKYGTHPLVNDPLKGDYAKRDIQRTAGFLGVPFSVPDPFPVNSIAACRAFYWLADDDPAAAQGLARRIMRNYFRDNRDLSDPANVLAAAAEEGIDADALASGIKDDVVKERLRREVDAALDRGVFGSPVFIVKDEVFWGTDRLDQLDKWLETGGW